MHLQSEEHASFFSLLQQAGERFIYEAKLVNLLLCFAETVSQEAMATELELSMDSVNRGLREMKDHSLRAD